MALRNAGFHLSNQHDRRNQKQLQQQQQQQQRLGLGRNSSDAAFNNLDSASYGTGGENLGPYEPNYDVPGESAEAATAWEKMMDRSGNVFYSNSVTGEVTWDRPAEFVEHDTANAPSDSLDAMLHGGLDQSVEAVHDREIPFLKDMVRNCPTKAFVEQFLTGPENYIRHINQNHGSEGTNMFHHTCMYNPKLDVIDFLVASGAEINKFTDKGLTAVDLCKNAGRTDVCKYLLARGGQTRLVFDAHQKRAFDRRENLKNLHKKLPSAMRRLMKMMQMDFENIRIQILEIDKYVEVRWELDEEHEELSAVKAYMESLADEEPNFKELRLERSEPWAEFVKTAEEVDAGPTLLYRFKPPWFTGYDADTERIHKGKQVGPPPGGPPPGP